MRSNSGRWSRGEGWVVGQMVLLAAILLAPGAGPRWSVWLRLCGTLLGGMGLIVALLGVRRLGRNLTPLPQPKDDSVFVSGGLYQFVRHPIYAGLMLAAFGWSLIRSSVVGLLLSVALAVLFDRKASYEEHWLRERFPNYVEYRQRVRKFIPWLY